MLIFRKWGEDRPVGDRREGEGQNGEVLIYCPWGDGRPWS